MTKHPSIRSHLVVLVGTALLLFSGLQNLSYVLCNFISDEFALQHLIHCRVWTEVCADSVFQFSALSEPAVTGKDSILCVVYWRLTVIHTGVFKSSEFKQVLSKIPMVGQKLGDMIVHRIEGSRKPRLQV